MYTKVQKNKKDFDMNKVQKIKSATRKSRRENAKKRIAKIFSLPCRVCRYIWNWLKRVCGAIWNWLKSIDVIGMINLTLIVVIIILVSALIRDYGRCHGAWAGNFVNYDTKNVVEKKQSQTDSRKVVNRSFEMTLPIRTDKQTNIKPQIKTIGVEKPEIVKELSLPATELPKQVLSGDVIVDSVPSSPVLSNGAKINGNLFIQNMRKYTIPCDVKINGHLFIRNVTQLNFCGKFKVNGNIYVNRGSAFGALPNGTKINGQIIL